MVRSRPDTRQAIEQNAFVLHATAFREKDLIIKCAVEDLGVTTVLARGARGSKKRFVGALDPLTKGKLRLIPKSGGLGKLLESHVEQRDTLDPHDLLGFFTRSFVAELIMVLVEEGHPSRFPFRLMDWVHTVFSAPVERSERRRRAFWVIDRVRVILLHREGRLPDLSACTFCQSDFIEVAQPVRFTRERGLLCARCHQGTEEFAMCGREQWMQLRALFAGVGVADVRDDQDLRHWLSVQLRDTTGKILKSEAMLDQFLRQGGGARAPR